MSNIIINGAKEGNLKNISLEIPRDKLVVLTGLSGSGKSTLAIDVLFNECQRQYLEAIGLEGIQKPKVDSIRHASPAITIAQNQTGRNPRSTVGTLTDLYTDLRMVYEKLGVRTCPSCGKFISAAACKEETEKINGDFYVSMYCSECGCKMEKLTRTHFSYNTRKGACKTCEGLGKVLSVNREKAVQEALSLENGAVAFWEQKYKEYQISILYHAFRHYHLPFEENTPVENYTDIQKALFYDGVESAAVKAAFPDILPPKTVAAGKFEGVLPILWRRMSEKGRDSKQVKEYFNDAVCPECGGERLDALSRSVTVNGTRLPELSSLSLEELYEWVESLECFLCGHEASETLLHNTASADTASVAAVSKDVQKSASVEAYLLDLKTKLRRLMNAGLGYLSLDRQTVTLSGGELQRLKLAAALDCDLTGIIYILDEPTVGLHPKDTAGMLSILKKLRDLGNTVIVIEHDPDVMAQADYIIDIGPGSGKHGGEIIGTGTLEELKRQPSSVTGSYLQKSSGKIQPSKPPRRKGSGEAIAIRNANLYNLKQLDVRFPANCLVSVTGVSGSGKSTLVFEVLAAGRGQEHAACNTVLGLEQFDRIVCIEQSAITRMKRSNIATYSEVYSQIRQIYGILPEAKEKGLSARHFSFNTPGGRCENCEGLGYVTSNMLFFNDIEETCPVCEGKQFNEEVLSVRYKGFSIKDVLQMSVEETLALFHENRRAEKILRLLSDVGLGYLELGQSLTTLSGGEAQRLKLAKELIQNTGRHSLYLMDEPTTGLHPVDVEHFLTLLNRIVDAGNTVIVVEHNQQIIRASDWVIDLGPEGGNRGGELLFEGTPEQLADCERSATGRYLF